MEQAETLEVFFKDRPVGAMLHSVAVDAGTKTIHVETSMSVNDKSMEGGAAAVEVREQRIYDISGKLVRGHQEMSGPSGKNTWDLVRSKKLWSLSADAGGVTRTSTVDNIKDDLVPSLAMILKIKANQCKAGDVLKDTSFEMVSAKNIAATYTCVSADAARNIWTFEIRDDISGQNQKWQLDKDGKTIMQELEGLFVAKKKTAAGSPSAGIEANVQGGNAKQIDISELADIFRIPKDKRARAGEAVVLTLASDLSPDESVRPFYSHSAGRWMLKALPAQCSRTSLQPAGASLTQWTRPTLTIQSDYPAIVQLAKKLKPQGDDPCDCIRQCNRYVYSSLAKRNTPTFSSAVETLKAGFGDCGEHSVLLAALLRASGIPSRVVLGLVYYDPKKAYVGHAWVMAYAGSWLFADPAFGIFPADRDRIPLIIDDTGSNAVYMIKYINHIAIDYINENERKGE